MPELPVLGNQLPDDRRQKPGDVLGCQYFRQARGRLPVQSTRVASEAVVTTTIRL